MAGEVTVVSGGYWTCTPYLDRSRANVFWVLPTGASGFDQQSVANAYSVRCVRAREGQAVPLFWIVGFLGSLNYEGLAGVQGILVGASGACLACSVPHRKRYGFR